MPFVPLQLPPGLFAQGTLYEARDRWFDANLVRFFRSTIRPVGGWAPFADIDGVPMKVTGVPRGAIMYNVAGQTIHVWGTHTGLFAVEGDGVFQDITPLADFLPGNEHSTVGSTSGLSYGDDTYGAFLYGIQSQIPFGITKADVWTMDTFGDLWVGTLGPTNGEIYQWAIADATATAIVGAPLQSAGVVVTAGRFLVALGAQGLGRRVAWASRETLDDWDFAEPTNTAGTFDLEGEGDIVTGKRGRDETIIWTESDVWAMRETGQPFIHGFQQKGVHCGAVSPGSVATFESGYAWMGKRGWFLYDGFVRQLPSEVADRVFSDFARLQQQKVTSFTNHEFSEIWWFYPSLSQLGIALNGDGGAGIMAAEDAENDRYVVWNYRENHWTTGALQRTGAATSITAQQAPVLLDPQGNVYQHELGFNHGGSPVFLQGGPMQVGKGDRFMHVLEIIPDEEQTLEQSVESTFTFREYPNAVQQTVGPFVMENPTPVRVSGREVQILHRQAVDGRDWRIGDFRLEVKVGEGR